jgi:farnesyl diphosphate synthase
MADISYRQNHIEKLLVQHLPASSYSLHQAMRYSVLNGGKRLRPLLVYGAGAVVNAPLEKLDSAAVAVECIHAYSLIHDDLPAMDNDDFRRGKPSCHKKFDEATAILAGDALQSLAFEILGHNENARQIILLAQAIGTEGMVLGQAEDIEYKNKIRDPEKHYSIHRLKTGKLITASVQLGMLCGNCTSDIYYILTEFSENFGLAFQLRDDLSDEEYHHYSEVQLKNEVDIYFEKARQNLSQLSGKSVDLLEKIEEMLHAKN